MRRSIVPLLLATGLLASCTGSGTDLSTSLAPTQTDIVSAEMATPAPASLPVLAYSGPKLPGRWGVYVEAGGGPSSYTATTGTCAGTSYDLATDTVVTNAILKTSSAAFDGVRQLSSVPGGNAIAQMELTGALLVRVKNADGGFIWDEAQSPARQSGRAEISAEVTVINARGRKMGTFTEKTSAISDDGASCAGGEALIAQAYERASRTLLERVLPDIATN